MIGAGSGFTGEEPSSLIFSGADSVRFRRRVDPGDIPTLLIPQLLSQSFQTNFSEVNFSTEGMKNSSREHDNASWEDSLFQTDFLLDTNINEIGTEVLEKRDTESAKAQPNFQTTFSSSKRPKRLTTAIMEHKDVTTEASVSKTATNGDSLVYVTPLPPHQEVVVPPTDQEQP